MIIYIGYHDEKSELEASMLESAWENTEKNIKVRPIKLGSSDSMENQIFDILLEEQNEAEWIKEDLVAIVSYSILRKLESFAKKKVDLDWVAITTKAKEQNIDVLGLFRIEYYKGEFPISLLEGATFQHGMHFIKTWINLLELAGYNKNDILDPKMLAFFCNWWAAKPFWMKRYMLFYKKIQTVINNSPSIQEELKANAFYDGDLDKTKLTEIFKVPYYTLKPFIFERLPCFFFNRERLRMGFLTLFKLRI